MTCAKVALAGPAIAQTPPSIGTPDKVGARVVLYVHHDDAEPE